MRSHRMIIAGGLLQVALVQCSTPSDPSTRRAVEDDVAEPVPVLRPASPALPAPPSFVPCPTGWQEVVSSADGVTTCEPWPADVDASCPGVDEARFPGDRACSPIGPPCPAGEWPDDLPADGVIHVRSGAPPGGDGTKTLPFGAIPDALANASAGMIVALGKGTFEGEVVLTSSVTLWGACVAETVLRSASTSETEGVVTVKAPGVSLRNLRITGKRAALWITTEGAVDARDIVVHETENAGIIVDGGEGGLWQNIAIKGVSSRSSDGTAGDGIIVGGGAHVTMARVLVQGTHSTGVLAFGLGTVLDLEDASIADTEGRAVDSIGGQGAVSLGGASIALRRTTVERSRALGVGADGEGTTLSLTDCVVRDTRANAADGYLGDGLVAQAGAAVSTSRTTIDESRGNGAFAQNPGTELLLQDTVIRATRGWEADGNNGQGLVAKSQAHVVAERSALLRNHGNGAYFEGQGTKGELTDLTIVGTLPQESDDYAGLGLNAGLGAEVSVVRGLFAENHLVGVMAGREGTRLHLTDVIIRDTLPDATGDTYFGRGLEVEFGAVVDVERAIIERNFEIAVFASRPGTIITLRDVVLRDTHSTDADGRRGRGVNVQGGARATLTRALVARNHEVGVFAADEATRVDLFDVAVVDTAESECSKTTCPDAAGGFGASAQSGAAITISRFLVSRSTLCGIQLVAGGTVDLHDGQVTHNVCGVNVQTDPFDIQRLQDDVAFSGNERNLDSEKKYVPDPAPPLSP